MDRGPRGIVGPLAGGAQEPVERRSVVRIGRDADGEGAPASASRRDRSAPVARRSPRATIPLGADEQPPSASVRPERAGLGEEKIELLVVEAGEDVGVANDAEDDLLELRARLRSGFLVEENGGDREPAPMALRLVDLPPRDVLQVRK